MNRIIKFMSMRIVALGLSVFLSLASIFALFSYGLNFGLDFTGGTSIELKYKQEVQNLEDIKQALATSEYADAVVQYFGTNSDILIRIQNDDPEIANKVATFLKTNSNKEFEIAKVEFVGPQVGDDLRDKGGIALLVSLAGILLYIAFRFQWKFGVGAIVALTHDVLITLGVLAVLQSPFDLTLLAAILALIGYSLNDKIVVYDRIRENFRILRDKSLIENIDISLTQTLGRTLATSISTLVALLAMLFLGGQSLAGFSQSLIIGIIIGTYSSIFIGTLMLIKLNLTVQDLIPPQKEEEFVP